jgi:N-acetylornithine carbamoyltransferase
VSHDIDSAYDGADMVYAKSWGAIPFFGNWEEEKPIRDANRTSSSTRRRWRARTTRASAIACPPAEHQGDGRGDGRAVSLIIEEAENRLHVQKALMAASDRELIAGGSCR